MDDKDDGDISQLVPPVATSINGVQKLLALLRTGTNEVQQLLSSECNVILECKKCSSLYRSIANFIAHKRAYCGRTQASPLEAHGHSAESYTSTETITEDLAKRDLDKIVGRLAVRASQTGVDGIRGENYEATQRTQYFTAVAEAVKERRQGRTDVSVLLSPLSGTRTAVSQCVTEQMSPLIQRSPEQKQASPQTPIGTPIGTPVGSPVGIIKRGRGRPRKISLDQPNGQPIASMPTLKPALSSPIMSQMSSNYCCEKCNAQFTTQKSLNLHETTQHMTTRMQYQCPCCKSSFCNLWSTYRHLKSIHNKNQEQVEKLKPVIRKRAFRLTVPVLRPGIFSPSIPRAGSTPIMNKSVPVSSTVLIAEDKAWVGSDNNFTVDVGDHRCGVCGLRFERRAALISHTNTCHRKPASSNPGQRLVNKSSRSVSPASSTCSSSMERGRPDRSANRKQNAPVRIVRGPLAEPSKEVTPSSSISGSTSSSPDRSSSVSSASPPKVEQSEGIKSVVSLHPAMNPVVKIIPVKTSDFSANTPPFKVDAARKVLKSSNEVKTSTETPAGQANKSPLATVEKLPEINPAPVVTISEANPAPHPISGSQQVETQVVSKTATVTITPVMSSESPSKSPIIPEAAKTSPNVTPNKTLSMNNIAANLSKLNAILSTHTQVAPSNKSVSQPPDILVKSNEKSPMVTENGLGEKPSSPLKLASGSVVKIVYSGGRSVLKFGPNSRPNIIKKSSAVKNMTAKVSIVPADSAQPKVIKLMPVRAPADNSHKVLTMKQLLPVSTAPLEDALSNQKAEIIVRTVSDKSSVKSEVSKPVTSNCPDDPAEVTVLKHAASMSLPVNWFAAGSADKKWEVDQSPRSSIQVRRDYGKMASSESSSSPRPESANSQLMGATETESDEEFAGWDGAVTDDVQTRLGLPHFRNMNLMHTLISVTSSSPSSSSSEDEELSPRQRSPSPLPRRRTHSSQSNSPTSPPGPRITRNEIAKQTEFFSRKTRAKSLDPEVAKRRRLDL